MVKAWHVDSEIYKGLKAKHLKDLTESQKEIMAFEADIKALFSAFQALEAAEHFFKFTPNKQNYDAVMNKLKDSKDIQEDLNTKTRLFGKVVTLIGKRIKDHETLFGKVAKEFEKEI